MNGIILSGGLGTRLSPLTDAVSKQLLPVYDKPMIYYSISTLMNFNIKKILIITRPDHLESYKKLLGTGRQFGIKIDYEIQKSPRGIAESLIIAEEFIKNNKVLLILGDNIFYGLNYKFYKINSLKKDFGARIFTYKVDNPSRYGVVQLEKNNIVSIEEKPKKPKSNLVATGMYLFDKNAVKYAKTLKPSKRGELEITDLNTIYLKKKKLKSLQLNEGSVWLDAGTFNSLLQASQYVQTIQERHNILVNHPYDIAKRKKWI